MAVNTIWGGASRTFVCRPVLPALHRACGRAVFGILRQCRCCASVPLRGNQSHGYATDAGAIPFDFMLSLHTVVLAHFWP